MTEYHTDPGLVDSDVKPLPAYVCEYCQLVSRKWGKSFVGVGTENGVQRYVDPWGNAYHVDLHSNLKLPFMRKIRHVFAGDYIFLVVWAKWH